MTVIKTKLVHTGEERGFTLVEALVSVAVLGILSVVLAGIIRQVTEAAMSNRSLGKMFTNLNMAGNQIVDDLRSAARNSFVSGSKLRFKGVDGDGKFETTTTIPHDDLGITTGQDVDYLQYHNFYSNQELDAGVGPRSEETASASERVRLGYFLCVPGSEACSYSVLGGEMGAMKLRERHSHEDMDSDTGYVAPPLSDGIPERMGPSSPMALNVDYLSFRYYDNETETWSNEWDSDSKGGQFPDTVEFAIRGYDPSGNVSPHWYIGMVALNADS
jgi:prepilin-type N-terminal cleavage/methylation domain-containing protein